MTETAILAWDFTLNFTAEAQGNQRMFKRNNTRSKFKTKSYTSLILKCNKTSGNGKLQPRISVAVKKGFDSQFSSSPKPRFTRAVTPKATADTCVARESPAAPRVDAASLGDSRDFQKQLVVLMKNDLLSYVKTKPWFKQFV